MNHTLKSYAQIDRQFDLLKKQSGKNVSKVTHESLDYSTFLRNCDD